MNPDLERLRAVARKEPAIGALEAAFVSLRPLPTQHELHRLSLPPSFDPPRFPQDFLRLLYWLRSPQVGVCLDTANSLGCLENVEQIVQTLGPRVVNLHLKDVGIVRAPHNKGFIVEGRPTGQGQIDFPSLLKRLQEFRVDPNAIVELWPPPEPTLAAAIEKEETWARESVAYARGLIPSGVAAAARVHEVSTL